MTIDHPFLVIGRAAGSDLRLDHWQVSRRHAYLQLIEGRYYCVDLGSRTGTHGGDATERSGWLERGRPIQIGPYSVHPSTPNRGDLEPGDASMPEVTWELVGRPVGRSLWRMDRPLVLLGRSPACRIRVVQPDVSKFHCSLVLTPSGVWVVDLLGQNGIFVNEEPVRFARLLDGDELRIGRHTFRPRYEGDLREPEPIEASPPEEIAGELALIEGPVPPVPTSGPWTGTELSWSPAGLELAIPEGARDTTVALLVEQFGLMQQQMFDQFHHTMMMMFEGFAALHREQAGSLREEFDRVRDLSREIEELRIETARLAEAAKRSEGLRPVGRPLPPLNGHKGAEALAPTAEAPKKATIPLPGPEVDIHTQLCLRLASIQTERQNRWQKILGMMSSRH